MKLTVLGHRRDHGVAGPTISGLLRPCDQHTPQSVFKPVLAKGCQKAVFPALGIMLMIPVIVWMLNIPTMGVELHNCTRQSGHSKAQPVSRSKVQTETAASFKNVRCSHTMACYSAIKKEVLPL